MFKKIAKSYNNEIKYMRCFYYLFHYKQQFCQNLKCYLTAKRLEFKIKFQLFEYI